MILSFDARLGFELATENWNQEPKALFTTHYALHTAGMAEIYNFKKFLSDCKEWKLWSILCIYALNLAPKWVPRVINLTRSSSS